MLGLCGLSHLPALSDPAAMMGSGNFVNGENGSGAVSKYKAWNAVEVKMSRMSLYQNSYWSGTAPKPTTIDAAALAAWQNGLTPILIFEYYGSYNDLGSYDKWYAIRREFALRFKSNSSWLVSQGIRDWGIWVYTAINEPDAENLIPKTGESSYYSALEGLADGVHSVDAMLRSIPAASWQRMPLAITPCVATAPQSLRFITKASSMELIVTPTTTLVSHPL